MRNTHETQRRKLFINTYKVIPLTPKVGVIQWVDGTTTLADYIFRGNNSAHKRYRGSKEEDRGSKKEDWSYVGQRRVTALPLSRSAASLHARMMLARALTQRTLVHWWPRVFSALSLFPLFSTCCCRYEECMKKLKKKERDVNNREEDYLEVCEHFKPVFHHFFLERFTSPCTWFERRQAYTRSVAASSIAGHILGIGDRHCQNILIDERTAEVIHIDFGIVFEMGLELITPERVPFRLTRDVVDGMGVCSVEGECSFMYRYILRESCSQFDSLPLTSLTISPSKGPSAAAARRRCPCCAITARR